MLWYEQMRNCNRVINTCSSKWTTFLRKYSLQDVGIKFNKIAKLKSRSSSRRVFLNFTDEENRLALYSVVVTLRDLSFSTAAISRKVYSFKNLKRQLGVLTIRNYTPSREFIAHSCQSKGKAKENDLITWYRNFRELEKSR